MKRIMFLLDYYTPNASPNGVCVEKVAKCFIQNGWKVSVVCFKDQSRPDIEIRDGIEIYRVCDACVQNRNTKIDAIKFYSKWLLPYKKPITERKHVTQQLYDGVDKLLSEKKYDAIICVHLPVETLIVGACIKEQHPDIVVVSYMLDSMSGGFVPRFLPEKFARKRKLYWENDLLKHFDKVILMQSSREHHNRYRFIEEWYDKAVYLDIPLLESNRLITQKNKSNFDRITITFCGLLNDPYRRVKHFVEIAKKCKKYKFVFAGSSNIAADLRMLQEESDSNIGYLGQVSHSKVKELLSEADILLNLGVMVPSAISGKIFEYMSYGKPIVSTYSIDNEACIPYLNRYELSLLIDERVGNTEQQAEKFCNFVEKTWMKRVNYSSVESIYYQNTPQAFVEYLNLIV